jgi:N utilization substance protein A
MAAKKQSKKKKNTDLKRLAAKKGNPLWKNVGKKRAAKKKTSSQSTAKRVDLKKGALRAASLPKKAVDAKTGRLSKKRAPRKSSSLNADPFASQEMRSQSGGQSGDLQGLSNVENADSESVDELIEEGNAFEADAVMGVESAEDEKEVRTHEVPENDVPEEYLDKD